MKPLEIGDRLLIDNTPFVVTITSELVAWATRIDGEDIRAAVYMEPRLIWDEVLREYSEEAFVCTNGLIPAYRVEIGDHRWDQYQTEVIRLELKKQYRTIETMIEKASRTQLEALERLLIEIPK